MLHVGTLFIVGSVAWLLMRAETLKGHLDGLLLASLEHGPRHGYAIMQALRAGSGGQFDLPTGTIYPALRRLERAGLVQGAWAEVRSEEHTSELQSRFDLVCRLLLEKKKK